MSSQASQPVRTQAPQERGGSELYRIARFVAVGLLNTAVGYGVFAAVWFATQSSIAAVIVGNIVGPIFNYFTIGRLVFSSRDNSQVLLFFVGYALALVINLLSVEMLVRTEIHALVAQLITMPVLIVLSYLFNSRIVFRRR